MFIKVRRGSFLRSVEETGGEREREEHAPAMFANWQFDDIFSRQFDLSILCSVDAMHRPHSPHDHQWLHEYRRSLFMEYEST